MADTMQRRLRQLSRRADERSRRLQLLGATWSAGGVDDATGVLTVRSELGGLAQEMRAAGLHELAGALQEAADALAGLGAIPETVIADRVGRRILILDESEVTRDVIAVALEGMGCLVTVASSLAESTTRLREFEPEVILLEPTTAQLGSKAVCDQLRAGMRNAVVPIVLFSSESQAWLARRAEQLAADGYITKDQGTGELLEEIDAVLGSVVW